MDSKQYYNDVGFDYNEMIKKRSKYLLSIEDQIYKKCEDKKILNYLDIGCGNGVRSKRIVDNLKPEYSLLLDESSALITEAKSVSSKNVTVKEANFLDFKIEKKFDVITCLWNVFGHLNSLDLRIRFLEKMSEVLSVGGCIFIDLNNRYNIKNYGFVNVIDNLFNDFIGNKQTGYFFISHKEAYTKVYIHNPYEFDSLIKKVGTLSYEKKYVDYSTGAITKCPFFGQSLYICSKE